MFEQLASIFNAPKRLQTLSKEEVAELLKISPQALEEFEAAYQKHALSGSLSDNFFEVNAKQAKKERQVINNEEANIQEYDPEKLKKLEERIVEELLAQTKTYVFDGNLASRKNFQALPSNYTPVTNTEIKVFPEALRPQLAGNLMKKDIEQPSYPHLLYLYKMSKEEKNPKKARSAYNLFRQGLDILDLDPIVYEMLGTNPNTMGNWLPELVEACRGQDFFKIPATTIVKVPLSLLQLTRQEYMGLTETTMHILDAWTQKAFNLDVQKEYFVKTGTYSSKFDFRNAYVHGEGEVEELGQYLLYIHFQALQMAGPLTQPTIYGVSTTNEWVVREFIPDKENNPCIYKGLPLHTEYRVFVDCYMGDIIGMTPYWEPETMKQRFGHEEDADNPHQMHDYVIYKMHEETLMKRYHENKEKVRENILKILPDLHLQGQWSIDIMQNGDDFWIIDMARAENSAFYNCVPVKKRFVSKENWIPKLEIK